MNHNKDWQKRYDGATGRWLYDVAPNRINGAIRSVVVDQDEIPDGPDARIKFVRIIFGHHHYVNISVRSDDKGNDRVFFEVGATHHGAEFDASMVDGDLEDAITFLRKNISECKTD